MRFTSYLWLVVLLGLSATAHAQQRHAAGTPYGRLSGTEITDDGLVYTVQSGDTLSEIAEVLEVSMDDVLRWNEGLRPDAIQAGQRLRIDNGLRRVAHRIQRGETLSRIAERYEVRVADLMQWNRRLSRDVVRAGREVIVFTHVPDSRSQSVGTPQHGRLLDGRQLPRRHPAIFVRAPDRAWGTDETIRYIVDGFESVRRAHADTPRVEVHDISTRRGGALYGHHSHESGRDADIAYYQTRCGEYCAFHNIGPAQLDADRQWALLRRWLEQDRVEAVFIDYRLQEALYEAARRDGASREQLSRWFQYPRSPDNRYGVIRHHPHHADHLHVRFACHESDPECR